MNLGWEIGANALNAVSILLAGRNSVHTWWTGIAGCALFGWVFFSARLYADATLQGFFIITSALGWYHWLGGRTSGELPIRHTNPKAFATIVVAGVAAAGGYGWLLYHFTDAFAPFIDSTVLAFSVVAQFLLMGRRIETWWCWLLVNTIAVPLFASRGLFVTAALYAAFWV
ncbi:MAG: nicotinamide riboside transporter PnuC, partial [Verrucomicrobiaceae bacterium]